VKWSYNRFYNASAPVRPPETELLFFNNQAPQRNRFKRFPYIIKEIKYFISFWDKFPIDFNGTYGLRIIEISLKIIRF